MSQPEDRKRLFKAIISDSEHHGGWQNTKGNNYHTSIHLPIEQEPYTRGLEGCGPISSAPPTHCGLFLLEHGQKRFQLSITLIRASGKPPEEISQRDTLQRPYGDHQRWGSQQEVQILAEREARMRENQATIQDIEEQLNNKEHTLIPSGSQGVNKPDYLVGSHHLGTKQSVNKIHHSSQSQVVSRRRKISHGKKQTSLNQHQKESDQMIQKLLDLVKEVHKSQEPF
ncbi:hypothetical protein O181_013905 [Austropuccinia psidii MF-1]|uniref:Uncharacterized protein n=1 Tax=Austropuccinia psidii MF-1 TaxID=1389203 RepID=A0A9Q3GPE4_9BASI|nr:hypothetical protein [Austropuccinia psidii MF-1]